MRGLPEAQYNRYGNRLVAGKGFDNYSSGNNSGIQQRRDRQLFPYPLPIHREAYQQGEINETIAAQTQTAFPVPIYIDETMSDPDKKMESLLRSDYTILIVDDNEELCMLFLICCPTVFG